MNNLIPRVKRYTSNATLAWEALNGVFAVYKPPVVTYCNTRDTIILRLCKDLNNMHVRKPIKHVTIEGSTIENMNVVLKPSYADHILVVGPRYQNKDIKITCANYLAKDISGLMICGINRDNYFYTGRIVEKATYKFVKRKIIDQLCASMQAAHQKTMFELCGVDIQSQAAFELAAQGLVRPIDKKIPMIYSIKCIDFTPPEFTLEVVSINEDDMYLKSLIHDLGMQLHSVATCTQIQCFRYALFDLNLALLKKHWSLQNILDNIEQCHDIFSKNQMLLKQNNPILTE
ncbi:mitochondrial mRNA pseudouridine synthase Trub2 isoform X3 [Odontomachus brunneus]|uniref:mitochondrial mRNA pseudouridine synthase Trub2 isoform X3 n=1 Tax=Odontomachus brunneus TaxID=486640 RepID=UPI0013F2AC8B|nr:mitochondrial mRNA pseudouridine synthase Trub2 isoform X3 [Odontomachus brunneus]